MSNETATPLATTLATTIATTIIHSAAFNFRNWKKGQAGYDKLALAIQESRITTADVKVTKDEEGNTDNDLYQRKPLTLALSVPLMASCLIEGALTAAQTDHLQALVNQACEKAHTVLVDNGNVTEASLISWEDVLAQPFKQRVAAVKVTEAMVKATNELFEAYLVEAGSQEKGILLMTKLATKKFGIAACATTKLPILEAIQGRIVGFIESLSDEAQHEHAPVLNLWATNLEKVINPELEEEVDEDMI